MTARRLRLLAIACLACAASAQAAQPPSRTYANPLDIDYRYNFEQRNEDISYRTGADPVFVRFDDAYYLFLTLADGYWRSTDLLHWRFIAPDKWPVESVVAPAAWVDGGTLYLMPSTTRQGPIYTSTDPAHGKLDYLSRTTPALPGMVQSGLEDTIRTDERESGAKVPPGPWDPALFRDDDGRWFLYWDSSNVFPLYGIELDPAKRLAYIGAAKPLFALDPERHGWERFGRDHSGGLPDGTPIKPYMEGAWMTKHAGRYYLQYGAPGTEYNAYANGTWVGDSPLGPFRYAEYNPVAYKPGGFVTGAGHGSTFQDAHGNWWNSGTAWIGANWTFERRVDLFPARFHDDGQMAVSTRFGDFPHWMPDGKVDDPDSLFTGWMLLSYRKHAIASSTLESFDASRAADEDPRTFWVAARNAPGETLTLDLGAEKTLRALQVNFADYKSERYADAADIYTEFALQSSRDGNHWSALAQVGDAHDRRDRANAYVPLPEPVRARYVRYVHGHVGAAHLAISDLRVFGNGDGASPTAPQGIVATRDADRRDATIRWQAVPGAVGYNVRWGIRRDRLTLAYQVFADDPRGTTLHLRALNVDPGYFVSVEAFDERGVSPLGDVVELR